MQTNYLYVEGDTVELTHVGSIGTVVIDRGGDYIVVKWHAVPGRAIVKRNEVQPTNEDRY